ncbi:FAD-binding oxidoreductase [Anaerolineae bacterium CFX7]|nr:FAD-binding oxidoreductase [Anaerolineae bacterium CFX7]
MSFPNTADTVIIGGGVIGTSAAFQLAARGQRVVLVEKNFLAAGSTGRSSAIVRQHYSNALTARMALYALRMFQNFDERVGGNADFRNTGFVVLVSARDEAGLRENVAMQQKVGIQVTLISPQELRELDPSFVASELVAAAYEPEGGYADPVAVTQSFAEGARGRGAEIWQDTRVTRVLMERERVVGVETTRGMIAAPNVVNCANAWAPSIAAPLGISLPIQPERHQIALFQQQPQREKPRLVVGDFTQQIYYRPEGPALTLVGSVAPDGQAIANPDAYNSGADDEYIERVGEQLMHRHPAMAHSFSKGGYAGMYAVTPDWHPIIDEIPAGSGFFVAAGFSGHGFKLSPAVGVMIADMVTRQAEPTAQLERALFRYARFAENDPVRGKYEYSIIG